MTLAAFRYTILSRFIFGKWLDIQSAALITLNIAVHFPSDFWYLFDVTACYQVVICNYLGTRSILRNSHRQVALKLKSVASSFFCIGNRHLDRIDGKTVFRKYIFSRKERKDILPFICGNSLNNTVHIGPFFYALLLYSFQQVNFILIHLNCLS